MARNRAKDCKSQTPEKILVVPDIHAKPYIVDRVFEVIDNNPFSKVIFLGDYEDDWDASPEKNYNTIKKLIELKQKMPDKIILLSGNHTQSYIFPQSFRCSGFNEETRSLVKDLYKTKIGDKYIFQFAFAKGNYLFTHAGVTRSFWGELRSLIRSHHPELRELLKSSANTRASDVSDLFNQIFITGMENPDYPPYQMFAQVGSARGGRQIPSPIWADKTELLDDPMYHIRQVVGHTPTKTIEFYPFRGDRKQRPNLIFCDTLSTLYEPYTGWTFNIGDSSLLQLTFGKLNTARINIIPKEDWLIT